MRGLAARNLRSVLEEIGSVGVLATLESIIETVEWFQHYAYPDLLFLEFIWPTDRPSRSLTILSISAPSFSPPHMMNMP